MTGTLHTAAALCLAAITAAGCGDSNENAGTPRVTARQAKATAGVNAPGVIVYRRYTDKSQSTGELWAINPDGTGPHKLYGRAHHVYEQPAISPDGRQVAFEECPDGVPCTTFLIGIDATTVHLLRVSCELKPICDISGPSWSAAGELAVTRASGTVKHSPKGDTIERSEIVAVGAD